MEYFLFFVLGLVIGSFLNCVIYRLEVGKSFLGGRSFCPFCKHELGFWDLVPVFSFLFLKGRCRYCLEKISWQYPLVELFTGGLFVFVYSFFGCSDLLSLAFWLVISCFLIVIFVYDLKHYIIPDEVVYSGIVISSLFLINSIGDFSFILRSVYSAFGAGLFFLLIVLITRGRGMGIGDIKLGFLMGLLLSFPGIIVALFLAFFTGALLGIFLIVTGKKKMKSEVPFGPFLVFGTFVSLFFGDILVECYFGFFLLQ